MTASLIISTYNWPEALELCLKSILRQTVMPFEVIVADDGSNDDTKILIESYQHKFHIPVIHIWHEDLGFRLAEIRNKAIKNASGDYVIQIDGDVILHKKFIEDHLYFAKENRFTKGTRCLIGEKKSKELIKHKNINISPFNIDITFREHGIRFKNYYNLFDPKEKATSDGILGSNMAFFKKDFIAINGYNNDFEGWGAEDKELAQRFVNYGLKQRKMKFIGIQFHIFHPVADRKNHDIQMSHINELIKNKNYYCKNGIKNE